MNRIDRLFAILLQMQANKRVHLSDLATHFEVSERTIFRDIAALSELGVPIVTYRGEGYALLDGFFLPPLILTEGEASALTLGGRMLAQQADGHLVNNVDTALTKLRAILPDRTLRTVEALSETIRFLMPEQRFNLDDWRLSQIRTALTEQRVLHITYHSYTRDEVTRRHIEPHELVYSSGVWYVRAYCRLRQAIREFRLDRIDSLTLTNDRFEMRAVASPETGYELVQLRFAETSARWVREHQHYAFQSEAPDEAPDKAQNEAHIIMTYHPEQANQMLPWILGWGAQVDVIHPESLRDRLREEAKNLLKKLT